MSGMEERDGWDARTRTLLGDSGADALANARVLVVGVGGVGGYAAEMLARSGVGSLTLVDADAVAESNLNRQLIALRNTMGRSKVELFKERIAGINPECTVVAKSEFVSVESAAKLVGEGMQGVSYDFVVDAIDTVAPKVSLIEACMRMGVPVVSSMGAGGRLNPAKVCVGDLWETAEDGLARVVRQRLKKSGMRRPLKVVWSREAPRQRSVIQLEERNKRSSYGTLATVPAVFGIYLASVVIDKILASKQ